MKWEHYLWTNKKDLIPETLVWAQNNGVIVREVSELNIEEAMLNLVDEIIEVGNPVMSCDLVRQLVVE